MKSHYNAQAAESIFDKIEALSKEEELKNKEDNQKQAEISEEDEKENTNTVDIKENEMKENGDESSQEEQVEEKLSKKERKERRKKAKYEAELKEIEGNQIIEAEGENKDEGRKKKKFKGVASVSTENRTVEQEEKSRKKHKGDITGAENDVSEDTEVTEGRILEKKHKKELLTEDAVSEDCGMEDGKKSKKKHKKEAGVIDNRDTEIFKGGKSKKKRKKGQDEAEDVCGEEPSNKKLKRNGKYNWDCLKNVVIPCQIRQ
jgi:hypothetical protein